MTEVCGNAGDLIGADIFIGEAAGHAPFTAWSLRGEAGDGIGLVFFAGQGQALRLQIGRIDGLNEAGIIAPLQVVGRSKRFVYIDTLYAAKWRRAERRRCGQCAGEVERMGLFAAGEGVVANGRKAFGECKRTSLALRIEQECGLLLVVEHAVKATEICIVLVYIDGCQSQTAQSRDINRLDAGTDVDRLGHATIQGIGCNAGHFYIVIRQFVGDGKFCGGVALGHARQMIGRTYIIGRFLACRAGIDQSVFCDGLCGQTIYAAAIVIF